MAQFDVYENPGIRTSKQIPYLVEIQGCFVEALATCVVVPLVCVDHFTGATVLNPVITVTGKDFYLSPAEITSVPRAILGRPVTSVQAYRTEIIASIDRLLL
jgi:toxin CcdB